MTSAKFKRLVNKHFKPEVVKLGWTGSDYDYRKFEPNQLVKVFGMYGSWTGGKVYCETGIHFDFLPVYYGSNTPIEKIKVTECLIRPRLSAGTWYFYENEARNIGQVKAILNEFMTLGKSFYADFENFPIPFDSVAADEIFQKQYRLMGKYSIDNPFQFAIMLKDINLHIGNLEKAKEFSEKGIEETKKFADRVLVGRKTKSYRMMEESIQMQIESLKIT